MATTFDTLPNEVLGRILVEVKVASANTSSLRTCLLVCRRWRDAALRYLYRHLVITRSNIDLFTTHFNPSYAPLVRSLTFEIAIKILPSQEADFQAAALDRYGHQLCSIVKTLINLTTFSVMNPPARWPLPVRGPPPSGPPPPPPPPNWEPPGGFLRIVSLSRSMVISLVYALPDTCVNLQIDLESFYRIESHTIHICEALRHVLPRMQHVRLHIIPICSQLFGTGQRLEPCGEDDKDHQHPFQPISLSNIKTLVVNCSKHWGSRTSFNCPELEGRSIPISTLHGWDFSSTFYSASQSLRLLTEEEGLHLPSASLLILGTIDQGVRYNSTFISANMANDSTLALPIWDIDGLFYLLRTIHGQEFVSIATALQRFAEGETWKNIVGGASLPAEVFEEEKANLVEEKLPVIESSVWRAEHSEICCDLWNHEAETGAILLDAEKRVGRDIFLARRALREKTPVMDAGDSSSN